MRSLFPLWREERDPFAALQHDLNRLFRQAGGEMPTLFGERRFPALDMTEKEDRIEISAELPGVAREDVKVEATGNGLVIRGEKKSEHEEKGENAYMLERSYGSFLRRVPLPFDPDPETIEAAFRDGVLRITVAKPAEARREPKAIEIKES
jgi:HSP20 family protein